jgi:hypothetical protein
MNDRIGHRLDDRRISCTPKSGNSAHV